MSVARARTLRKNMSDAEGRLWFLLRSGRFAEYKFRRQYPIGPYIADFACVKSLLIVEVDGGQHSDNANDAVRTAYIEKEGWRVLRFWNHDVLQQTEAVLETIGLALADTLTRRAMPVGLSHEGEANFRVEHA